MSTLKAAALTRVLEITGGSQSELARRMRANGDAVTQQAISLWIKAGEVPGEQAIPVARAVEFKVTPHELDNVAYPNPWDGLPASLAKPLLEIAA